MPRKSTEALLVPVDGTRTRLEPPKALGEGAARVFRSLVASVDSGHFTRADLPLLVEYSRAVVQADHAQREIDAEGAVVDGKASPWIVVQEKSIRAMVALSMRLRLSPQSRLDRATAGAKSRSSGSRGIDALGIGE